MTGEEKQFGVIAYLTPALIKLRDLNGLMVPSIRTGFFGL